MKKILFLLLICSVTLRFGSFAQPSGHIDVLFMGNSFTYYNGLPEMFQQLSAAAGKDVSVDSYLTGGQTMEGHLADAGAMAKVRSKAWTYIVLQGWAGLSVADDMKDYGTQIMDIYRGVNPNGKVIMYMVHGTTPYPGDAEMNSQQSKYNAITSARPYAKLAPAMWGWRQGWIDQPGNSNWLDAGDNWHPGKRRTYVSATSIYSTIYLTSCVGLTKKDFIVDYPYTGAPVNFDANDLPYLQGLAWNACQTYGSGGSTLPTVTLTSPATGASFAAPATITLSANASGNNSTVSKVDFYAGTNLLYSDNTAPYAYSWSNVATGTYSISAKVTDSKGAVVTSGLASINVYLNDGSSKLTGTGIGTPGSWDGSSTFDKAFDGNLTTFFDASTADGNWVGIDLGTAQKVTKIRYCPRVTLGSRMIGGKIQASNTANFSGGVIDLYTISVAPAESILTTQTFTNTSPYRYYRYLSPTGAYGNIAELEFWGSGNQSPVCNLTSPVNGSNITIPADVSIAATATDADGTITKVEFYNGTTLLGTATSSPYIYTWTNIPAGTFSLTAKATDNSGNTTTSAAVSITAHYAYPTCAITSPANNAIFTAPASIKIDVTAASTSGTISKVEFYNGSTLIGTTTTSPYTFTWSTVAAGTYSVTGRAYDNYGGSTPTQPVTLVVNGAASVAVTGVSVSPSAASINAGSSATLTATVAPANATNKNVTWSSGNTSVATVNPAGVVTGVAAGSATITVTTTDGNKTSTCAVTVTAAGSSAKLTGTIIGTSGSWNNDAAVTKDKVFDGILSTFFDGPVSDGVWVGLDLGSAKTISLVKYCPRATWAARMNGGKIQGSNVADFSAATDLYTISGSPTENTLTSATISNATAFRYVRYLAPNAGYGNIAELEFWGVSGTSVTVTGVTVAPTTASVAVGATNTLTATVAPANATNKSVTWSSNNTGVATVNATGVVTGVSAGTATITVTTTDGNKMATCVVTVTSANVAVTGVTVSPTTATISAGGNSQLTATVAPANTTNKNVSWSSNNTSVATVNATGIVTGVAAGTATITVTTTDGSKTATAAITVTAASNGTNLLTINPSFESQTGVSYPNGVYNGITGWVLNNTAYNSISVSAGSAQEGNNKLNLVYGGKAETLAANRASVTAGQTYTLGVAISKVENTNTAVQSPIFFRIDWYNSSNALISSSTSGNLLGGGTSAWATYTVTATAPANAVKAGCYIELVNTSYPNNDVANFSVDNVRLNSGGVVSARGVQATNAIELMADNNLSTSNVSIYPNPLTTGSLIIRTPGVKGSKHLNVFDAAGNKIYTKQLPAGSQYSIDLSGLKYKGVCLVEVSDNKGLVIKKLIVE